MSNAWYYEKYTTTVAWVYRPFGFLAGHFMLVSSGTDGAPSNTKDIEFSFDGSTIDGQLAAGESIVVDKKTELGIYVRSPGGANQIARIWAWVGE